MNYNKAMKNIIDYIKEYGNLTLEEYPFNNVDSLILSQISYIKFENSSIDIESEIHLLSDFENEIDTLKFLNKLPQEEITAMAKTYVDGFHEGFIINNIDMSPKRSVNIRYTIGFEPVVREAVRLFSEIGLAPIIYRLSLIHI